MKTEDLLYLCEYCCIRWPQNPFNPSCPQCTATVRWIDTPSLTPPKRSTKFTLSVVLALQMWNKLPIDIKTAETRRTFCQA